MPKFRKGMRPPPTRDDNSNSQFALMALWVSRRHDVPVERTMALAFKRYKLTQKPDGRWSYLINEQRRPFTPSMTCVGLIGLAMGHGSAQEAAAAAKPGARANMKKKEAERAALKDPAIQKGLRALGHFVGRPTGKKMVPLDDLYFLWSLERTAVLYNLKTIAGKDWYGWAAEMLLVNQQPDGHWEGGAFYHGSTPTLDTCLALLILKRANLVQDLTDNLRDYLAITDPDSASSPGSRK